MLRDRSEAIRNKKTQNSLCIVFFLAFVCKTMAKRGLKRKIPIEKRETKSSRAVTFSKRRKGLFSKASELCLLSNDQIAILATPVSSNSHTSFYSFGHSSVDSVVEAFLANERPKENLGFWWDDEKVKESDDIDVLRSAVDSISSLLNDLKVDLKKNDGLYQNQTLIPQNCSPSHGFQDGNKNNEEEHALMVHGNLDGFDQQNEMVTQNQQNGNSLFEEFDDLIQSFFCNINNNDGNTSTGNLDESNEELDYDQIIDYDTDVETVTKIFEMNDVLCC